MKKNRTIFPLITLIIGILIGFTFFALLSFTNIRSSYPKDPTDPVLVVSKDIAVKMQGAYLKVAASTKETGMGARVDSLTVEAMKLVIKSNPGCDLRVYIGIDDNVKSRVGIIVPVDKKTGLDLYTRPLTRVVSPNISLCPIICDDKSPFSPKKK